MKVLHLLQSPRFSGAENVVCQIIGMFKDCDEVEMAYCSQDGSIRDALKERDIAFYPMSELSVSEVKRVIGQYRPDIIHAHDMRASFVAARACKGIPLISHIHNNAFDSRGISPKSIAYLFAAKKAKHIIWVSQSSFDGYVFHKLFQRKSSVLYNIIDIDALYQKMNSDPGEYHYDMVYLGRLTFPKNPQRLMRVFEKVAAQLPNVKIGVIGTGELEAETKALCRELNLQQNVEFLGFQSNPLKILYDAKVMIMTSRWEGTPMCALEAMALGVPIVSTPSDGLCELIEDDETGYLSDDDAVLASKALAIIQSKRLYTELSKKSEEKARKINAMRPYKEKIMKLYEESQNV